MFLSNFFKMYIKLWTFKKNGPRSLTFSQIIHSEKRGYLNALKVILVKTPKWASCSYLKNIPFILLFLHFQPNWVLENHFYSRLIILDILFTRLLGVTGYKADNLLLPIEKQNIFSVFTKFMKFALNSERLKK